MYDEPVPLVVQTPIMPDMARPLVVAWWQYQVPGVRRAYFPALMAQANRPEFWDALYLQHEPHRMVWGVYNCGPTDRQRQRALGRALEQLRRELGEG